MLELVITDRVKAGKLLMSTRTGPTFTHLVSIFDTPDGYNKARPVPGFTFFKGEKLALQFDDIIGPTPGCQPPTYSDIQKIINFAKTVKEDSKILVHCVAGISRSTAAAFILLCTYLGEGREMEAMEKVISVRPIALPNTLMVVRADKLLDRKQAMVQARWLAVAQDMLTLY